MAADMTGFFPDVAVSNTGQVHAVWGNRTDGIRYQLDDGPVTTIAPPGYNPAIALDTQGNPHIAWNARVPDTESAIFYTRWDGRAWTPALRVSQERNCQLADISVARIIRIVYVSQTDRITIHHTSSSDGQSWSTPQLIATGSNPRILKTHMVWNGPPPAYGIYYARNVNGRWQAPTLVATGHKDLTPDLAMNSQGQIGIVWERRDTNKLSFLVLGGSAQPDVHLPTKTGIAPRIACDSADQFHIVFQGAMVKGNSNIYHRIIGGNLEAIAAQGTNEQTPSIAARDQVAIMWWDSDTDLVYRKIL